MTLTLQHLETVLFDCSFMKRDEDPSHQSPIKTYWDS
jgi:hypothetical protein